MSDDRELESWRTEWRAIGGSGGLAAELSARVARDGKRIRRSLVTEIVGGLAGVALATTLVVRMHGEPVTAVVCAAVLVFTGVWTTRVITLREGSLRATTEGLDTFVALTRRRIDDDLRWVAFGTRAMQIFAALLVPWAVWALVARWAVYSAEPWRGVVGFGTAAAILAFSFAKYRIERRSLVADRARFEALVAERDVD